MPRVTTNRRLSRRHVIGAGVLCIAAITAIAPVAGTARGKASALHGDGLRGQQSTNVGPGSIRKVTRVGSYQLELRLTPNRANSESTASVTLLRNGRPVRAAKIRLTTMMVQMNMGYTGFLNSVAPGRYVHAWPGLMPGSWRLHYELTAPSGDHVRITLVDHVRG